MALYTYAEGQWVRTVEGDRGFVYKIQYGGYSVHIPSKHIMLENKPETKWYTESNIQGSCEDICEEAREAFVNWALDERRFDLLEG